MKVKEGPGLTSLMKSETFVPPFLFPQVRNTRDTRARLSPLRGGNLPPRVPSCLSIRPLFPSHCSWSILDTQSPAIEKITAAEILVFAGCSSFFTFEQLRAHNVQPTFSLPSLGVCSPSVTVVRAQTERDRDHRLSLLFFFFFLHDFVVRCSTFQTLSNDGPRTNRSLFEYSSLSNVRR